MRLGLFGGTFDPIHLAHLILAEQCREHLQLDRLELIVAGQPPHKNKPIATVKQRIEMAQLAIAGHPQLTVSDIETRRPGPHYSYETIEAIRAEHPDDDLFFLIGGDSLADLATWKHPERIARAAQIVVARRPDAPEPDRQALATILECDPQAISPDDIEVPVPPFGVSSRDIRGRLAAGRSIRYLVPAAVEAYIDEHGLYRPPPT